MPPADMPMGGMPPEGMPPEGMPQDEGSVMINIPKSKFDEIQLKISDVMNMLSDVMGFAEGINQQQAEMEAPMPPEAAPAAGSEGDMDAFLQSIAEEGNVRSK